MKTQQLLLMMQYLTMLSSSATKAGADVTTEPTTKRSFEDITARVVQIEEYSYLPEQYHTVERLGRLFIKNLEPTFQLFEQYAIAAATTNKHSPDYAHNAFGTHHCSRTLASFLKRTQLYLNMFRSRSTEEANAFAQLIQPAIVARMTSNSVIPNEPPAESVTTILERLIKAVEAAGAIKISPSPTPTITPTEQRKKNLTPHQQMRLEDVLRQQERAEIRAKALLVRTQHCDNPSTYVNALLPKKHSKGRH